MKQVLMLCGAATLAGCSTTQRLNEQPDYTFTSTKSADALEECIALNMGGTGIISTIRGDGRRMISFGREPIVTGVVTIIEGDPNVVEIRADWRDNLDRRVMSCA